MDPHRSQNEDAKDQGTAFGADGPPCNGPRNEEFRRWPFARAAELNRLRSLNQELQVPD
jgi:hypothetical protein